MGKLHQPHDQFFKVMLSDITAAKVFISKFLPERVTELIDLSTLRITDHTFLSDDMYPLHFRSSCVRTRF